jgi:predicted metal-dependent phosphotriesterase family hydrolase
LNPVHTDGLIGFFEQLKAKGFTQPEIDGMAKRNPARLLGLE